MDITVTEKHNVPSYWKNIVMALIGIFHAVVSELDMLKQDVDLAQPARFRSGGQDVWMVFEQAKQRLQEGAFGEAT